MEVRHSDQRQETAGAIPPTGEAMATRRYRHACGECSGLRSGSPPRLLHSTTSIARRLPSGTSRSARNSASAPPRLVRCNPHGRSPMRCVRCRSAISSIGSGLGHGLRGVDVSDLVAGVPRNVAAHQHCQDWVPGLNPVVLLDPGRMGRRMVYRPAARARHGPGCEPQAAFDHRPASVGAIHRGRNDGRQSNTGDRVYIARDVLPAAISAAQCRPSSRVSWSM